VLSDPEIGGFQVRTLLNQPAHEVNLAVEEFFADRRPDDLLLLHVSCHGVKDEGGELYFATANTRLRRLAATAVAAEFVNRRMSRSRSRRVVLLLDCCYAGAFERGMTARAGTGVGIEEQFGGRGRAVITASSAMEYAFEGDELADAAALAPSVFTSALVEGLETGEADRDQDGLVGLDELYDYVYDRVRAATPNQTSGKWTFGVQGELYIAHRTRPVTTPAPLPPELQEAVDSPFAGVRAGAVQELERLLHSRHAGRALAARLALERLTEDDSRKVAAAATAALGEQAPPQPPQPPPPQPAPPVLPPSATPEPAATAEAPATPAPTPPPEPAATAEAPATPAPAPSPAAAPTLAAAPTPAPTHPREPAAPSPAAAATPAGAPAPTAAPPTSSAPAPDGLLRVAGPLAILGAVTLVVALFPAYQWGEPLPVARPHILWYELTVAALAAGAGLCLLQRRTRRSIGPGLLLGLVAASIGGFLGLLSDPLMRDGYGIAWGIGLIANLMLVAACLAGLALARSPGGHRVRRLAAGFLPWVVVPLGAAAAVAMVVFALVTSDAGWGWYVTQFVWAATMALVVPAWAAKAVDRRFGAALLAGWAAGSLGAATFHVLLLGYLRKQENPLAVGSGPMIAFGLAVLALLVMAVLLGRAAPAGDAEPAEPA
jgi:Caspase domain